MTSGAVMESLRQRRYRWAGALAGAGYLLIYLVAIQDVRISPGRDLRRFVDIPSVEVVPGWTSRMFEQIAPFAFEPVAAVYPVNHVTILVAPMNIAMGTLLGVLVGLNIAVAWHVVATARACRTNAFGGILGALPAFLGGFVCCVPAVALVVGAQFTVFLVAVRSWFFPFAVVALVAALWWNARRLTGLDEETPASMEPQEAPASAELPERDGPPRSEAGRRQGVRLPSSTTNPVESGHQRSGGAEDGLPASRAR